MVCYFARHGQSEANILKIFANEPGKYPLTDLGRQQAQKLAASLESEGITRCFASPLLRAIETATIVCDRLGITFDTANALREFSVGDLEGSCDPTAWREYAEVERAWLVEGRLGERIGGGECFQDIADRFIPFMDTICDRFGDTDERILLIGHGGTFACMLPLILKNVDRAFAQTHGIGNASVIKAVFEEDGFRCLQWGDVVLEPTLSAS